MLRGSYKIDLKAPNDEKFKDSELKDLIKRRNLESLKFHKPEFQKHKHPFAKYCYFEKECMSDVVQYIYKLMYEYKLSMFTIFHKELVTGRALGDKRVFWVVDDAFVVNIVFGWEQAVANTSVAEKGMIASHRFPMYRAKANKSDVRHIKYFFHGSSGKKTKTKNETKNQTKTIATQSARLHHTQYEICKFVCFFYAQLQ